MSDYDIQKIDIKMNPRAETGPMEFTDDWPGVFIRGDNAAYFAMCLSNILEFVENNPDVPNVFGVMGVIGLQSLLTSCNVNNHNEN